ncbi:TraR/DksA C4-type zinc finger protein [Rhizobium azibense]|uniref:TraR/DksA family transcriptional regulator n=1 Tax=Rhizobium azibense TaxID=1136135 RepID=A0A4V6P1C8_9HYPH|nr:TraR/DksA C4-type zinc finger protein [Rhizobium azibense]TCU35435.1 TraR/DksA family transcriptional regulator [Rhizobium azibense]
MNGNALFDLAEIRAEEEREAQIKRATAALKQAGSIECEDCGGEIAETRRRAMPSATRCFDCQQRFERRLQRGR